MTPGPRRFVPWRARRREEHGPARTYSLRRRIGELEAELHGLDRVLDGLEEGVIAVDRSGLVVHVNDAAADLVGIDPERALGHHLFAAVPCEPVRAALDEVMRAERRSGEDGPLVTREATILRPTGEPAQVTIAVRPLHDRDHKDAVPEGAVAVVQDVTDLRRLERARGDFFTNVSHELKTPVTAIRGMVETILDDPTMREDTRERFLRKVTAQADRLSSLVRDLLALSRVESGGETLERVEVDLASVAEETLGALGDAAERAGVELNLDVRGDRVIVIGDEEALRQALGNLVVNAISYSDEGGRVGVVVERVRSQVTVQVADRGAGIPAADLDRIFERFYRVDKARSRERGGTGIGLSIVRHVALAHGGQVSVESELGAGSTFVLQLPAA